MQVHGGNSAEVARKYGLDEQTIIDFSSNINPLGFPTGIQDLLKKDISVITRYPDTHSSSLRKIITSRIGVPEKNIIVGNGSTELIYLLPRVFNPQTALILQPTFSEYQASLESRGCAVRHFSLDEKAQFRVNTDDIIPLMSKVDIMYVCNPNNPTGVLVKRGDLKPLVTKAAKRGILFVVDESFMDFAGDESFAGEAVKRKNLIILKSMTKFFGIPGLRLGYLIAK
ncbi:MAG: aminotransferase class I/II-fold pyridoxal phosphate-dependent enzyme, partial [Thermodesulfobacteriota bacterium]|nr:aminotransferase class I/II-fold pyridoxal phosphate-dependent enzyme [Thermodesulfobacteriota bacterium]